VHVEGSLPLAHRRRSGGLDGRVSSGERRRGEGGKRTYGVGIREGRRFGELEEDLEEKFVWRAYGFELESLPFADEEGRKGKVDHRFLTPPFLSFPTLGKSIITCPHTSRGSRCHRPGTHRLFPSRAQSGRHTHRPHTPRPAVVPCPQALKISLHFDRPLVPQFPAQLHSIPSVLSRTGIVTGCPFLGHLSSIGQALI